MPLNELKKSDHSPSFSNITSYPMGYLVPTYCELLAPGDFVSIDPVDNIRLDPLAFPVMDSLEVVHGWYFVPCHEIYLQFDDFIRQAIRDAPSPHIDSIRKDVQGVLPWLPYGWFMEDDLNKPPIPVQNLNGFQNLYSKGLGILDQLGVSIPSVEDPDNPGRYIRPTESGETLSDRLRLSAMPFLGYHRLVDDFFVDDEMEFKSALWPIDYLRDTNINRNTYNGPTPLHVTMMIDPRYWGFIRGERSDTTMSDDHEQAMQDSGWHLRRASWGNDLLTTRRPKPQIGEAELLAINGQDTTVNDFKDTLALQNFKERQNRTGQYLSEFYEKFYGVKSSDEFYGSSEHIKTSRQGLDVSDVLQTSATEQNSTPQANPAGYSRTVTSKSHGVKYNARAFGYLYRISYVIPKATYHYGIDPKFTQLSPYDFFNPKFGGIGWEPSKRAYILPQRVNNDALVAPGETPNAAALGNITGWNPPFDTYRRKLSRVKGAFNWLHGDVQMSGWTFGRDYSFADHAPQAWLGEISAAFRKADPPNRPFTVITDSPSQVQHFTYFNVHLESLVPKAINHKDSLH